MKMQLGLAVGLRLEMRDWRKEGNLVKYRELLGVWMLLVDGSLGGINGGGGGGLGTSEQLGMRPRWPNSCTAPNQKDREEVPWSSEATAAFMSLVNLVLGNIGKPNPTFTIVGAHSVCIISRSLRHDGQNHSDATECWHQ